jgi:thiosulfate dehydrogenase (quinone)
MDLYELVASAMCDSWTITGATTQAPRRKGMPGTLISRSQPASWRVGTYSCYRGSVVTPFHGGPISPTKHHLTLSDARLLPDGSVRFHVYLDAGTPEAPVHLVTADLLDASNQPVAHYDAAALSALPKAAFANDYAYNKFAPGPFGIRAPMGAAATVTLPASGATPDIKVTDKRQLWT